MTAHPYISRGLDFACRVLRVAMAVAAGAVCSMAVWYIISIGADAIIPQPSVHRIQDTLPTAWERARGILFFGLFIIPGFAGGYVAARVLKSHEIPVGIAALFFASFMLAPTGACMPSKLLETLIPCVVGGALGAYYQKHGGMFGAKKREVAP